MGRHRPVARSIKILSIVDGMLQDLHTSLLSSLLSYSYSSEAYRDLLPDVCNSTLDSTSDSPLTGILVVVVLVTRLLRFDRVLGLAGASFCILNNSSIGMNVVVCVVLDLRRVDLVFFFGEVVLRLLVSISLSHWPSSSITVGSASIRTLNRHGLSSDLRPPFGAGDSSMADPSKPCPVFAGERNVWVAARDTLPRELVCLEFILVFADDRRRV